MGRLFVLAAAATLAATMVGPQVHAMQVRTIPTRGSTVTLIRDGCGQGYFRDDNGECRQERERSHLGIVGDILGVHPRDDQPREDRRICPEGYHMGTHSGVCKPND
jgi:hypothetical protein